MTDFRLITVEATDLRLAVTAWLDSDSPKPTGGYGGQDEVARPRNVPLLDFNGGTLYRQELNLIFDGFKSNQSIEGAVVALERMARPQLPDYPQPPIVRVGGAAAHPELEYLIENITWGDAQRDSTSGARIRQAFTLALVQRSDATILVSKPGGRSGGNSKSHVKRYTVKSGDNLMNIAHKFIGSSKKWRVIAKLNHKKNSRDIKVGEKIKLP